jgi:hypothetical protein
VALHSHNRQGLLSRTAQASGRSIVRTIEIAKTQYRVADFVRWQKEDSLILNPSFQRRYVWKPNTKSYFIDTVIRGWPTPIICIRGKSVRDRQWNVWEVVDGQQRLRTLFSFIDEALLPDFDPERDRFTILGIHSKEAAGKRFEELSDQVQKRILSYQFSTQVLPASIDDSEVLEMFARLNSAAIRLNNQELRNATFSGAYKTAMYQMSLEQLKRWRDWRVFSDDRITRMKEVELTSDIAMNMLLGLTGKTQSRIDNMYSEYENEMPGVDELKRRFAEVVDAIDELLGSEIVNTVYSRPEYFFTLYAYLYDTMYGLGSTMDSSSAKELPPNLRDSLLRVDEDFRTANVPLEVLPAVQRASADFGRRRARLGYLASVCNS